MDDKHTIETQKLRAYQAEMARAISHPLGIHPQRSAEAIELVSRPVRGLREDRLSIYAEAYHLRVEDSLKEIYPKTETLLCKRWGEDAFEGLIAHYLEHHPPASYTLGDCGAQFPHFLGKHPFGSELPFLQDLAQTEWALYESFFHTKDFPLADALSLDSLSIEQWARAQICLDSSATLFQSDWPIPKIIQGVSSEHIEAQSSCFIVYRKRPSGPKIEALTHEEFEFLSLLPDNLGSLIERWGARPAPIHDWFQNWFLHGFLAPIEIEPSI